MSHNAKAMKKYPNLGIAFCISLWTQNGYKLEARAWAFSCQVKRNLRIFVTTRTIKHCKVRPGVLGGLLGVRPGDKLLRYKVMVVVMAVTIVVVWMGAYLHIVYVQISA